MSKHLTTALALSWSFFQLGIVQVAINDTLIRSIHLAFAIALAFLSFPFQRPKSKSEKGTTPFYDYFLSILAGFGALYLFLDYEGIATRPGLPLSRDLIMGGLTLILLLEAARRCLGPALAVLGTLFLLYCFLGPHMPDLIAHRGASFTKIINHMYLTTEGIFGVPLRVSANFVFLFVLFGALLERAGAGQYFIQLAYAALGMFRGGPAKASIAASGLLGMVSGSSIANTVTTGTFTIPLMKKVGFPAEKAAAVEVAASTNGQLMPPIMGAAAFIIAEFLGIAYLDVVRSAFIPAVVSYIGLFTVVHLEASKLGLKRIPRSELPPLLKTFIKGFHYLIPVLVLIYTLVIKRQSAPLAAFHAILLVMFIVVLQKPLLAFLKKGDIKSAFFSGFSDLYQALVNGARSMVPIGVATATAGIIVGTITLTGLGQNLLELIETISMGNFILVLVLTAMTSLILGMGLPTTANYIVMASLTAPIIVQLADQNGIIVPAIAAHLFVFYFGILADDTPPVGLAAYAASAVAGSNPIKTGIQGFTYDMRTAILPFIFLFNTDLLLIEGVKEGMSPMSPSSWLWIDNWFFNIYTFLISCLAMFSFIAAVMGWFITKLSWVERILMLLICFSLFRCDFLAGLFKVSPKQWMVLPPLAVLAILSLFQLLQKNRHATNE